MLDVYARVRLFLDVLAAVAHCARPPRSSIATSSRPTSSSSQDGSVKLLDFGIAKLLEESAPRREATELTREGGRALTPAYAAPEQLLGEPVTIATDVYALGVLLYVLLSGQHPAGATSSIASRAHQDDRRRAGAAAVRCGRLDADAAAADARRERSASLGDARQAAAAAARRPRQHRRQGLEEEPGRALRDGRCVRRGPAPLSLAQAGERAARHAGVPHRQVHPAQSRHRRRRRARGWQRSASASPPRSGRRARRAISATGRWRCSHAAMR